ncbi:TROVE domain-containing protein [Spongiactinospora sp. TRM90649]|uniref:TROVE domain-containing protein n=1 Tax=Spongiactinospora sp. TRM90649 TaxID=3031114 RepID=UPI0023F9EC7F|nr:TROVE domain-containing protein [Spongiactinospora sp. TRM90649]MDF5756677.1 TROVE domain-containing protein [Spongiactinospora sp. TRM90649]
MSARRDPLARITTTATPQTAPLPGRADQVRNAAGGYVWEKDIWRKLTDFLILGTQGGTYYVGEQDLTTYNADVVFEAIKLDGTRVVALVTEISTARPARAPKPYPALFALAAAHALGDEATKYAARRALPEVARTTNHLSAWFGYRKALHGKAGARGTSPVTGASLRRALAGWFLSATPDRIAFKAAKAAQRKTPQGEDFALRDALRLAHISPALGAGARERLDDVARHTMLGWIAGTVSDEVAREALPSVDAYLTAQDVTTSGEAVALVTERGVPWEFLPDAMLREPAVWEALIDTVGLTALIRNLARMTRIGALAPMNRASRRVVARLTDRDAVVNARIHPMDAWLALRVYGSGHSQPSPQAREQTWRPVPVVLDALEETFDAAFGAVEPTGKRLLVAVDSSGSMSWGSVMSNHRRDEHGRRQACGSSLGTPYEVGCAMAVVLSRIERGNAHVIDVDTRVHDSRITPPTNLREIAAWSPSGGGTDLSLPFTWAREQRMEVDGIVVFTDNETWAGRQHASQALTAYRRTTAPAARVVVTSMTTSGYTIGDPADPGVLNVAGIDASLPMLVNGFIDS